MQDFHATLTPFSNPLLLHCCCAPCTTRPLALLVAEDWQPVLFTFNPNIYPPAEHQRRENELASYAKHCGVRLRCAPYVPMRWEAEVASFGGPYPLIATHPEYAQNRALKRARCAACYRLRLEEAAAAATTLGCGALATTLAVSPYQEYEALREVLADAADAHGLQVVSENWQGEYPEATRQSRALGLYRQNYCGCRYSLIEAQLEREARKLARKQARAKEAAGLKETASGQGALDAQAQVVRMEAQETQDCKGRTGRQPLLHTEKRAAHENEFRMKTDSA